MLASSRFGSFGAVGAVSRRTRSPSYKPSAGEGYCTQSPANNVTSPIFSGLIDTLHIYGLDEHPHVLSGSRIGGAAHTGTRTIEFGDNPWQPRRFISSNDDWA
jgi:hypothetical protein